MKNLVRKIRCRDIELTIGERTLVMGILNLTPDSFAKDGIYDNVDAAVYRAMEMVEEGADLIDIGGESTRPGCEPVSPEEEMRRVLPVIEELADNLAVPLSIDTYKPEVAEAALEAGAGIVNDIFGLRDERMLRLIARLNIPVIIMHMQGNPQTMQDNPTYEDCVREIKEFLAQQAQRARAAGLAPDRIIVDPGIGFGKSVEHNLEILRRLREFEELGYPVLIGTSRKSFIGKVLNLPVQERLEGSAAAVAIAIANGADIVRVHDVKAMVRVARMTDAVVRGWR